MDYLILFLIYILSIFSCRYVYRLQYKWGIWGKESCRFSILWIIPYLNTLLASVFFLLAIGAKIGYEVRFKNKKLKWFTNQDL